MTNKKPNDHQDPLKGLERFTVRQRLWVIVGVIVVGTLAIGFVHQYTANSLKRINAMVERQTIRMESLDGFSGQLAQANILIGMYGREKTVSPESIDGMLQVVEEQAKTFSEGSDHEVIRKQVEGLNALLPVYKDKWHELVGKKETLGVTEKDGLRGQLRNAVHAAEAEIKKADELEMLASMLMLRRHEKDFMLRGKDKYLNKWNKEWEHFEVLLQGSALAKMQKETVRNSMVQYRRGFLAYVNGVHAYADKGRE
ncbi:MAG: hypothetical protein ACE5DZ_06480, partial [Mariprofundus sp.]